MIVTKLAIVVGVLLVALLCWLAVAGVAIATELVITVGALVVLVGGGNWLSGRSSAARSSAGRTSTGRSSARRSPER